LGRKIDLGSFGDIYLGSNVETGQEVAIKLESTEGKCQRLPHEAKVYTILAGGEGIPRIHWHGIEGSYNVMVIDLLGPSLQDLFHFCNRKFGLKTILWIADQMISRVELLHAHGLVHRDIKPGNFVIGLDDKVNQVHIIDFGLAKPLRGSKVQQRQPCEQLAKSFAGTPGYASVNTHLGMEQTQRDDLESIGYVLLYFSRGHLPWHGVQGKTPEETFDLIMEKKLSLPAEVLCQDLPSEFVTYFNYCRGLNLGEHPDYSFLRDLLQGLFHREGFRHDHTFDWTLMSAQATAATARTDKGEEDSREIAASICSS